MFITGVFTSGGSVWVLTASNNRSFIVFTTGVKKESSGYSE